jgi:hypothetical protein
LALQVLPLVHAAVFPSGADAFGHEDEVGHDNEITERSGDSRKGASGGANDLVVCVDAPSGGGMDGVMVMAGFWAARRCNAGGGSSPDNRVSGSKACEFLSDVLFRCQTATEDAHDQHSFNIVLSQYSNRRLISFAFLDSKLFLNGKFFAGFAVLLLVLALPQAGPSYFVDMEHVRRSARGGGGSVAAVQNNWITGIGGKLQRFRRHGLWFLDSEEELQVRALL